MSYTVMDVYRAIDALAPFATAEGWDNSGLLLGGGGMPVQSVLLALDATAEVVDEALAAGVQLIVTHHPVIFHPLKRLDSASLVYRLVQGGVALIAAHTNLDVAQGGVNDCLAAALGLSGIAPLLPEGEGAPGGAPCLGRVGDLGGRMTPQGFAEHVKCMLGASGVRVVAGGSDIYKVAVCGGSGGDLIELAAGCGAQALVTADVKHDRFLEAAQLGLTLIDAGHYTTEAVVLEPLRGYLQGKLPGVEFKVARSDREIAVVI